MKKRPAGAATLQAKRRAVAAPAPEPAAEPGPEPVPAFEFTRCHSFVPEEVRELYSKTLPMAFAVPKEKRHKFEQRVVAEACAVLSGVREEIQRKMEEASAAKERAGSDEAQCTKSLEEQKLVVDGLTEAFKSKAKALAEVALAYRSCREKVKEAKLSEEEGSQKIEKAKKDRVALEAYLQQFEELKAGTFESPEAEKKLKASLPAMLKTFSLTEALVQAAPTALAKAPGERGDFDSSVVSHVEEELLERLASYVATIQDAEPAAVALGEQTQAAVAALAEAGGAQLRAADGVTEAKSSMAAANEKAKALRQNYQAMGESIEELQSTLENLTVQLEQAQEDENALASKAADEGPEEATKSPESTTGEAQADAPAAAESEGV